MNPQQVNIEKIEAYCQGTMNPEEREVFKKDIRNDNELAQEVKAYQKIFSGLETLADASFKSKLEAWSDEWSDADEEEITLIQGYLNDELHPELRSETDIRLKTDTAFAKKVAQYKTLFSGFQGMADQDFSRKMQGWETENNTVVGLPAANPKAKIRTLYRRLAVAASFLLIVSFGIKWYAGANYGPDALVQAAYFKPETGGSMGSERPEVTTVIEAQFAAAHEAMESGDYQTAIDSFDDVLMSLEMVDFPEERANFFRDNARYSKALALLADGGDTVEVKELLLDLINTTEDDFYRSKSEELLEKINSFWFKLG
ncbi:MAG: hypothetical protein KDC85_16720 [Saprospiraceae bacterium]|nr:hypothetical protein [Saprospiraceae bacterium]MCB9323557.1 hypothetical protein [Lewinellaceae bacterium]